MGVFKLGGMTMKSLFKKAPTRRYPYEKREPFERTRAMIDMTDVHDCIFCSMCQRKCPADAIVVDKKASKWTYWPYKCVACESCVEACPKSILEMLGTGPGISTTNDVTVEYGLTAEEIAEKERLAAEKKAKILAAQKAKKEAEAKAKAAAENEQA